MQEKDSSLKRFYFCTGIMELQTVFLQDFSLSTKRVLILHTLQVVVVTKICFKKFNLFVDITCSWVMQVYKSLILLIDLED